MSSASTRTFEFNDDKSSKFKEITHTGNSVTVRYCKNGTNGQTQEMVFDDASVACRLVTKLINENTGKGYVERGGTNKIRHPVSTRSDCSNSIANQ